MKGGLASLTEEVLLNAFKCLILSIPPAQNLRKILHHDFKGKREYGAVSSFTAGTVHSVPPSKIITD